MIREAVEGAPRRDRRRARATIEVGHVGNFAAELYAMQGHLGAFLVDVDPAFAGLPTGAPRGRLRLGLDRAPRRLGRDRSRPLRLRARRRRRADEDGRSPAIGGDYLGTAAWYEREAKGVEFPFPKLFGRLGDEYDRRYGLKDEHLAHIAAVNYDNAQARTRSAQTRTWYMSEAHACATTSYNAVIGGRIKVTDCSQVTDGAVAVVPRVGGVRARSRPKRRKT